MSYYASGIGFQSCATTAAGIVETYGLLAAASGQCGAFAFLLERSLAVNGIHSTFTQIQSADNVSLMVIKNWSSGSPSYVPQNPWEFKFLVNAGDFMVPVPPSFGDLTNGAGLAGQNNNQPSEKVFNYHFIVQIPGASGNQYFDPSYGVTYPSDSGFESQSVYGYAEHLPPDRAGTGNYHLRYAISPPLPQNITFTPVPSKSM